MTNAVALAQGGSLNTTMRNRIINGDMRIDQRNNGASVTPTNAQYVTDRWAFAVTAASKFTAQQGAASNPPGFPLAMLVTSSSAYSIGNGDIFAIFQRIEGFNTADLGWGTASAAPITISFFVRSSLTGTFGGSVANNGNTRSYPFSYTINAANTWEQKTVTIAGDTTGTWLTTNGVGLNLSLGFGVGSTYSSAAGAWASGNYWSSTGAVSVVGTSGATFYVTGVQLEAGTSATPFEFRQYGTELALCQRYCATFGGLWNLPSNSYLTIKLPTVMRGSMSFPSNTTAYGQSYTPTIVSASNTLDGVLVYPNASSPTIIGFNATATAEL